MRRLHYSYLRPPFYFFKLFVFFFFLSGLLSFQIGFFLGFTAIDFFYLSIFLLFLLMLVGSVVEYFKRGEYMTPLEVYDVMGFVHDLLDTKRSGGDVEHFFLRYTKKPKLLLDLLLSKRKYYSISTICKRGEFYEVTLLDEAKVLGFFFVKFLSSKATLRLYIKEHNGSLRIVRISR